MGSNPIEATIWGIGLMRMAQQTDSKSVSFGVRIPDALLNYFRKDSNMYICPTCHRGFNDEEVIAKHFLQCWHARNPNHESAPSPLKTTTEREVSEDVINFFASFNKCKK